MTGAEAIALARRCGVTLEVFLGKLRLRSENEPDESLVRLVRDRKQEVVNALLEAETEPDRWRRRLAQKIETVTRMRGLSRHEAEREAFQHLVMTDDDSDLRSAYQRAALRARRKSAYGDGAYLPTSARQGTASATPKASTGDQVDFPAWKQVG
jgi:hypothetical protein